MAKRNRKSHPTWTDVKAKLDSFDRAGLLGSVQNLYTAQGTLGHFFVRVLALPKMSRNGLRCLGNRDVFLDYKKAVDQPEGLTELMVFYAKWRLIFAMSSGCKMRGTSVPSCGCLSKPPSWQTPYHPLAGWVCGAP
jgi:hypothetical protein